nr:hypothetical protein [Tanacetum cinerariifolium]
MTVFEMSRSTNTSSLSVVPVVIDLEVVVVGRLNARLPENHVGEEGNLLVTWEDGGFHSHSSSLGCSGVWVDIIKAFKHIESFDLNFKNSFVRKVADGADTSFWFDPWCDDGLRLKDKFLRLYAIEYIKNCKVKDRGHVENGSWYGSWAWRIPPRGRAIDDLSTLSNSLNSIVLNPNGCNKWVCLMRLPGILKWNSWIPKKVNIIVWKASLDRLATKVWGWWSLPPPISFPSFSAVEIASGKVNIPGDANLIKATNEVFHITIWAIWNWRNHLIHAIGDDIDSIKMEDIFPSIQRMAKLWMSTRISSKLKTDWNCWVARPFDLFS